MRGVEAINQARAQLRDDAVRLLVFIAASCLVALTVLSGSAGALMAGRLLARVRHVTEAARATSVTSLDQRLNLAGPQDEIKELGDTFDGMLARLDDALGALRRFAYNASHGMRTPLAVTRTAVEVTLAKPNATVAQLRQMGLEVVAAMSRAEQLVDALLVLSRSEQRLEADEPNDLADMALEAIDAVQGLTQSRHIRMRAQLQPAPVTGHPSLLARAVANLVENAVRHNNDNGAAVVRTGVDAGQAWLSVTNDGPDLSAEEIDRLFEPFHRGERSRHDSAGAGLGLSLVAAVVRAHGGKVTAVARTADDGGGLRVVFRLPANL